jgi:sarcosine oxidase subunit gamma
MEGIAMNVETQLKSRPAQRAAQPAQATPGPISLGFLPEAARFSLRIAPADLAAASKAFGLALPPRVGEASEKGGRRALCLGPDEWLLRAGEAEQATIEEAFAAIYGIAPHSLVSIGDREIGLFVEGPEAATLLSVGCPIDLDRLAVGSGKRTVFDGVQVVLFRESAERFTLEAWRSFVPHVWELLNTANRELIAGL